MLRLLINICVVLTAGLSIAAMPASRTNQFTPGSRGTVLMFVSSMCPCTDQHKKEIRKLTDMTRSQGINYYCIFSNISENDARVGQFFKNVGWEMPYVLDSEGTLARKYGATHTPQVMLLEPSGKMIFRGPIDDSSKNLGRIKHAYLRDHVMQLLETGSYTFNEVPAVGCWLVTQADLKK